MTELLLWIEAQSAERVRKIFLEDELISRQSLTFRDASLIGKEGCYCRLSGSEEACNQALLFAKVLNSFAGRAVIRRVEGEEKRRVIEELEAEARRAVESFGAILG